MSLSDIKRHAGAMRLVSIVKRCSALALLALLGASAFAGTTESFTFGKKTYEGSQERKYKVYVPAGLSGPAPMVMALHGCRQTNDDVLRDWGLTAAAERFGFILVAPFITTWDGQRVENCWGYWFDGHRHEGRGEPEDLHQIAREVEGRQQVDPLRRYIIGLSSGGAMSVVAATTHNEYWAAAASGAGLPYGEDQGSASLLGCPGFAQFHSVDRVAGDMRAERNDGYAIPLMVLQNDRDCTVLQQASRNLRDAHLAVFGDATHDTPAEARAAQRACTPAFGSDHGCQHVFYSVDGRAGSRSLVETVFYSGPLETPHPADNDRGHYWIGGEHGGDGKWSVRRGPSYPDIAWDFFARHARAAPIHDNGPQITLLGANPMRLERDQVFTDPGATATDPQDGSVAVIADCSVVDTSRVGSYACTYRATDRDGHVASATRGVVVGEVIRVSCATISDAPFSHIGAGRAVAGGWFGLRALANADARDIGFAWDTWSRVTVREGEPGRWYGGTPPGCDG